MVVSLQTQDEAGDIFFMFMHDVIVLDNFILKL